ncbi:MAG TPA: cytochrome c oxidase subunit 3 [Candidatus Acidoferrum sp.]|nr:cytochrome c oxidase subunit 3 [Candidatus Acidoferrum sp.]
MASTNTTAAVDAAGVLLGDHGRLDSGSAEFSVRLRRARLGLIVGLTGIVMIFVSYSSAYVVRKGLPTLDPQTGTLVHDWLPLQLPNFLLVNTLVLLISTLTMEFARRQALRDAIPAMASSDPATSGSSTPGVPWLSLTAILGLSFLAGQWLVWRELAAGGFYVSTSPSSSFFYLLTGTHGVHLLGGILALMAASATSFLGQPAESRGVAVDITAWYWHFMTFLWVYILCLLEFAH